MNVVVKRILPVAVTWAVILGMASRDAHTAGPQNAAAPSPGRTAAAPVAPPLLTQYCITCHNGRLKTAGLALDALDFDHVGSDAATWEKVIVKVRAGMMPPSGARRPDRAALDAFASDLEGRLDRAALPGAGLDAPS